jgi:hypothetical protein
MRKRPQSNIPNPPTIPTPKTSASELAPISRSEQPSTESSPEITVANRTPEVVAAQAKDKKSVPQGKDTEKQLTDDAKAVNSSADASSTGALPLETISAPKTPATEPAPAAEVKAVSGSEQSNTESSPGMAESATANRPEEMATSLSAHSSLVSMISAHSSAVLNAVLQDSKQIFKKAIAQNWEQVKVEQENILKKAIPRALRATVKPVLPPDFKNWASNRPEETTNFSSALPLDQLVIENINNNFVHSAGKLTRAPQLNEESMLEEGKKSLERYKTELEQVVKSDREVTPEIVEAELNQLRSDAYHLAEASRFTVQLVAIAEEENSNKFLLPDLDTYSEEVRDQRGKMHKLAIELREQLEESKKVYDLDNVLDEIEEIKSFSPELRSSVKAKLERDINKSKKSINSDELKKALKQASILKVTHHEEMKSIDEQIESIKVVGDVAKAYRDMHTSPFVRYSANFKDDPEATESAIKFMGLETQKAYVAPILTRVVVGALPEPSASNEAHPEATKAMPDMPSPSGEARNITAAIWPFGAGSLQWSEFASREGFQNLAAECKKAYNSFDFVNRFNSIGAKAKYEKYTSEDKAFKDVEEEGKAIIKLVKEQFNAYKVSTFAGKLLAASVTKGEWNNLSFSSNPSKEERSKALEAIDKHRFKSNDELSKEKITTVKDCAECSKAFSDLYLLSAGHSEQEDAKDLLKNKLNITTNCAEYRTNEIAAFEKAEALKTALGNLEGWAKLQEDIKTEKTTLWDQLPEFNSLLSDEGSDTLNKIISKVAEVAVLKAASDEACENLAEAVKKYADSKVELAETLPNKVKGASEVAKYADLLYENHREASKALRLADKVIGKGDMDLSGTVPLLQPSYGVPGYEEDLNKDLNTNPKVHYKKILETVQDCEVASDNVKVYLEGARNGIQEYCNAMELYPEAFFEKETWTANLPPQAAANTDAAGQTPQQPTAGMPAPAALIGSAHTQYSGAGQLEDPLEANYTE